MPNHCLNTLSITGITPEQWSLIAETFVETEEKNGSFLQTFCPEPSWLEIPNELGELPTQDEQAGISCWTNGKQDTRWYDWRLKNWGTKWDVFDCDQRLQSEIAGTELEVSFSTAWSPLNEHFLETISTIFPDALFKNRYEEEGVGYCGVTVAKDGRAVDFVEDLHSIRDVFIRKLNPDLPEDADTFEIYEEQELWEEFAECLEHCLDSMAKRLIELVAEKRVAA